MGLAAWIHVNGSLQVMYDASGVRLHAGRQAEVRSFIAMTSSLIKKKIIYCYDFCVTFIWSLLY
jgi:acid phosphatase family membrane protein YuiD